MDLLLVNGRKPFPLEVLQKVAWGNLRLSVITESEYVHQYSNIETVEVVDSLYNLTQVRDATLAILEHRDIDAVVGPGESCIPASAYIRSLLGLPGMQCDVANGFTNKYAMKQRLTRAGMEVAPFAKLARLSDLTAIGGKLGWPVVMKPTFGGGGMRTFVISSPQEARASHSAINASVASGPPCVFLLERFIDMEAEYHCDAIVYNGETQFASVSKYSKPVLGSVGSLHGSYTLPETDSDRHEILQLHTKTVAALGLELGVTHLEVFKTGSGFLVGEIACRPGGGGIPDALKSHCGIDLWEAFVETSLGKKPNWSARSPIGLVARCSLPIRHGTVAKISSSDFLTGMPGLISVDLSVKPGDVIRGSIHSSSSTGTVLFQGRDVQEMEAKLAHVGESFYLEMAEDLASMPIAA